MWHHQSKRKHPTLQTDHEWQEVGLFYTGLEHCVSDEEREAKIEKVVEEKEKGQIFPLSNLTLNVRLGRCKGAVAKPPPILIGRHLKAITCV
jgi:hypothetical protein